MQDLEERDGANRSLRRGQLCPNADPCWFEGVSEYSYFPLCPPLTGSGWVNTWTGYWISGNGNYPATGDRYYGHIVAGVVGTACAGKFISTEIVLPAGTSLDFGNDPNGRVRCYYTSPNTGNTTEVTDDPNAFCDYYGPGAYGADLGGRAVANYGTFEIIFPLRSNQPLHGLGGNDRMVAKVETEDSNSLVAPQQWVTVATSRVAVTGQRQGDQELLQGTLTPVATARNGAPVKLVLYRKKNGSFRKVDSGIVGADGSGMFAATSPRPGRGDCKVKAAYPPTNPVATASDGFRC